MSLNKILIIVYCVYLIIFSLIAYCLYGKDKKMAKNGTAVRVKEKTLLEITIIGGAFGAFVGRKIFHHKTDKKYFSFIIYISLLLQIVALAALIVLAVA